MEVWTIPFYKPLETHNSILPIEKKPPDDHEINCHQKTLQIFWGNLPQTPLLNILEPSSCIHF